MASRIASRASILERRSVVEPAPQAPRTILVVEDEQATREFVQHVLESAGYTIVCVANGPDAIRVAAAMPALDMVVTDVMMPEMSGNALVRRLRRRNPAVRALYVTGYRDHLFDEKVILWENEAFIDKKCSSKALLDAVSLLWGQRIDGVPRLHDATAGTHLTSL